MLDPTPSINALEPTFKNIAVPYTKFAFVLQKTRLIGCIVEMEIPTHLSLSLSLPPSLTLS